MAKMPPLTGPLVRNLYGPLYGGGEFFSIGDSIEAGGYNGGAYPSRVHDYLGGAYRLRAGFAAGGKRLDQMLSEQWPVALASGIRRGIGGGGTNDISQGATQSVMRARLIALFNAVRRSGIHYTDLGTMPGDNLGHALLSADLELWRALYCAKIGMPHVDRFRPYAVATGGWKSGLNFDSVHPNYACAKLIAASVVDRFENPARISPLLELVDRAGATVVLDSAVSFRGVASGVPSGWFSHGSGGTYSVVADGGGDAGNWFRCSFAGSTSGNYVGFNGTGRTLAGLGWSEGDRILVGAKVRWSSLTPGGIRPTMQFNQAGSVAISGGLYQEYGSTSEETVVFAEYVLGSGSTVNLYFTAAATEASYFEIARPIIYNLTVNGLA